MADGARNNNNIKLSGTLGYVAPEYLLDGKPTKLVISSYKKKSLTCNNSQVYSLYLTGCNANIL